MRPESFEVPTPGGTLSVHHWQPARQLAKSGTVVTVHPWATLGGGEHNCIGTARLLAAHGVRALSFDMNSSWMIWGIISSQRSEVSQVEAVCDWAQQQWGDPVVLFGSSAGAPIAGSALGRVDSVAALVCVGYTWGWFAGIAFSRHFKPTQRSTKPKLFIQGEADEFTAPSTLRGALSKCQGETNDATVVERVGHFELESPQYDEDVARMTIEWLEGQGLVQQ